MNVRTPKTRTWQTAKQAERQVCVHNMGRDTKGNPAISAGL